MRPNKLRELQAQRKTAVMGWVGFDSPYLAEMVGSLGYDAVLIDCQHGMIALDKAVSMLQAVSATQATPLMRVYNNSLGDIHKALDSGAYGVICPLINTPEEAHRFGISCRYPFNGREGLRSYGPARGLLYGGADYVQHANDTIMALAMIETPSGLDQVEAIAAVASIDGLFIGPSDLAISLGLMPGADYATGPLSDAINRILAACQAHGKYAGVWCADVAMARNMASRGFDMVVPGTDSMWLRAEGSRRLTELRA
jgi:4-hydroxy-2-oxoheptanedioate aldolase